MSKDSIRAAVWDRDRKAEARRIALGAVQRGKHSVVMMPGRQALCCKKAVELGTFDSKTTGTFIERDGMIFPFMRDRVKALGLSGTFVRGDLHDVKLRNPIDYAFFDFCGSVSEFSSKWIATNIPPLLAPNAELAFTFSVPYRFNSFVKHLDRMVQHSDEAQRYLNEIAEEYFICNSEQNKRILFYIAVLKAMFHQYDFRLVSPPAWYYDIRVPMALIVIGNFTPRKQPHPVAAWLRAALLALHIPRPKCLSPLKIITEDGRSVVAASEATNGDGHHEKNPIMVEAGRKSWVTRRRNLAKNS